LPIQADPYIHGFLDAGRGNILATFKVPNGTAADAAHPEEFASS
jgi:hypothetical protein